MLGRGAGAGGTESLRAAPVVFTAIARKKTSCVTSLAASSSPKNLLTRRHTDRL